MNLLVLNCRFIRAGSAAALSRLVLSCYCLVRPGSPATVIEVLCESEPVTNEGEMVSKYPRYLQTERGVEDCEFAR